MKAMEISRTGLDVEWRRLELIADNIANANSISGGVYRPQRLISGPKAPFGRLLDRGPAVEGAAVYGYEPAPVASHKVHEPQDPSADKDGFVERPGLDHAAEMTLMVRTARTYEANVAALGAARQMYAKALEIGHKS